MDWAGWAVFGLVATTGLTAVMIAAQLAGRTRLDLPLMLGTITTEDPDRARVAGFAIHLAIGQVFALFYAAGFAALDRSDWWLGALFGLAHAAVALSRARPAAAGGAPADGERTRRSRLDRRARTAWPVRPQLRHRDPAGRGRRPRRLRRRARPVPGEQLMARPRADRRLRPHR